MLLQILISETLLNICSDDYDDEETVVNKEALENVELAIGYLCHRFNKDSNRRWVVFVDKFYDGLDGDTSNGGTENLF